MCPKGVAVTAALLIAAAACAAPPPAPEPQAEGVLPPAPEISVIVVPVRASLAPLLPRLEAEVPKTFRDSVVERGFTIRYDIVRDPVKLAMIGTGLHATTVARYTLEACRPPLPCISCGIGEPRREAQIAVHAHFDWDANWRLKSSTTARAADFPRRCQVTPLGIDITDRFIRPAVEEQLREAARTIDRNTPSLSNLKPQAQQIWSALQAPVELAPRSWLVLEPLDVSLSPISGSQLTATSTLALRARTRVVLGEKPPTTVRPLPPLRVAAPPASSVRVPFDLEVPYEEASRLISTEMGGRTYRVGGRDLRVEQLHIEPAGAAGKVRLTTTIDYRGGLLKNYRGPVELEGTPSFDAATATLRFADLDYTLRARKNPFFRIGERAAHESLRARLRESAVFPLAPRLAAVRDEVTRALNRPLAPGVTLRGRADAIQPLSATPAASVMVVRVVATGTAMVEIR